MPSKPEPSASVTPFVPSRTPRPTREETDAERRERYLGHALSRGARDEAIEVTLRRAEAIRAYIEAGTLPEAAAVNQGSCSL